MVAGMEGFIQRFKDYADCYTIIGGAACDILMTEADIDFKATMKQLNIIMSRWADGPPFLYIEIKSLLSGDHKINTLC